MNNSMELCPGSETEPRYSQEAKVGSRLRFGECAVCHAYERTTRNGNMPVHKRMKPTVGLTPAKALSDIWDY